MMAIYLDLSSSKSQLETQDPEVFFLLSLCPCHLPTAEVLSLPQLWPFCTCRVTEQSKHQWAPIPNLKGQRGQFLHGALAFQNL